MKKADPTPEQCFQIRTLLIHEYRRIILRDWAGSQMICYPAIGRATPHANFAAISIRKSGKVQKNI